jgi:hypothetical protein
MQINSSRAANVIKLLGKKPITANGITASEYSNAAGILHIKVDGGSVSRPASAHSQFPGRDTGTLSSRLPSQEFEVDTHNGTATKLPLYVKERGGLGHWIGNETPVNDCKTINRYLKWIELAAQNQQKKPS